MASDLPWGDYLTRAMSNARMTQAELARATGISDSVISRWRRGESVPDLPNLRRLAVALRVPLLDLAVAAGHMSPAEARMRDQPKPPEVPVGAGVDPELLAELAESRPDEIEKVRAFLLGIKAARN